MSVNHLGATASISLVTALPGSGKTLRLVKFIKEAHERGELVFVSNLNGLQLPHAECKNPRDWRSLPPGSVLVVDEAQMFFRSRRGGDPPEYITAMETIRHHGIRLILATQQPDYLDSHLRGLVGLHEHLVRENGKEACKIWRHNEVMDNVRSEKARARYDVSSWEFDKSLYPLYKSAEVHTVKRRLSSRFKKGLVFASLAALILGVAAYRVDTIGNFGEANAAEAEGARVAGDGNAAPARRSGEPVPLSAEEWAAQFEQRHPAIPASAPVYDAVAKVQDYPRAYCMSSGENGSESCSCMTQQGTRINMPVNACITQARWGAQFDPYKAPPLPEDMRQDEQVTGSGEGRSPSDNALRAGIGSADELQASYGAFRSGG
jgi:hypothetical protein